MNEQQVVKGEGYVAIREIEVNVAYDIDQESR
jgi:hypothetical protein